ncbi:MAG: AraC family transcriptional regulator [Nocardioidaceae bacterium]|nr:AraC family transcriptional regulator [Nocardioidaceae bacterium]
MPDRASRTQAAILRPEAARERITVGRQEPPADLAAYVDYLWWVTWSTPEPHHQEVIPRPVVHLSAEWRDGEPRLLVNGVYRRQFVRVLEGAGRTVAAAFLPGGFRPLLGGSVSALRDRVVPALDVLGVDDRAVAEALVDTTTPIDEAVDRLTAWLADLRTRPDPMVARLAALVTRAEEDTTITRAEQLAAIAGVGMRTLQRQFVEYVGIGPKWVVQRSRLLDVAAAAHADQRVDWAELAAALGYADQSHLIRGFTALVGAPPATYARR